MNNNENGLQLYLTEAANHVQEYCQQLDELQSATGSGRLLPLSCSHAGYASHETNNFLRAY